MVGEQNEDYGPGNILSNSSEELLLRVWGGGVSIYVILVKEVCAAKHTSQQKVPAGHKEQMSPSRISMLF